MLTGGTCCNRADGRLWLVEHYRGLQRPGRRLDADLVTRCWARVVLLLNMRHHIGVRACVIISGCWRAALPRPRPQRARAVCTGAVGCALACSAAAGPTTTSERRPRRTRGLLSHVVLQRARGHSLWCTASHDDSTGQKMLPLMLPNAHLNWVSFNGYKSQFEPN